MKASTLALRALLLGVWAWAGSERAQAADMLPAPVPAADADSGMPQPLKQELFEGILTNPPFTRSLGLSDTLILTGVARFDNQVYAV